MQIIVSGRHMGVSDALKDYCHDKAQRLLRFYDRIKSIEVILDGHDGQHSAEMIVHSDGTAPFVASEEHKDIYAAVDLLIDKLERQISRHKEKLRNRKHPPRTGETP
jgi:putative sigma-54 modulation protein